MTMRRVMGKKAVLLAALAVLVLGWGGQHVLRLYQIAHFFDEGKIVHHFTRMNELFATQTVPRAAQPTPLPQGEPMTLPERVIWEGGNMKTDDFLRYTGTTGLLVMKDGQIRHEAYHLGHDAQHQHVSWSVAKSMISALIGVALAEGRIAAVTDPVDRYAAGLRGTAYEGVQLKDVLQMSSGVAFNEDYHATDSDIVRLAGVAVLGGSFNDYARNLKRAMPPGVRNEYISFDTQVLAMVLQGATGVPLAHYMSEKLWQPLGTEQDGYWVVDSQNMEMAFGGFNASLRDYARFGQLYLQQGRWQGKQIVPAAWIEASLTMDGEHLRPENLERSSFLGYGYQWWIPERASRDYLAIGVYNQFIYIAPERGVVIVKNSANHHYESEFDDLVTTWLHLALFRAIAEQL